MTVTLSPDDDNPPIRQDRGVTLVPEQDRRLQGPDLVLLGVEGDSLLARCSCWWRRLDDGHGAIGHYAAADRESGAALLERACEALAAAGCARAVGPMDGNTWRRYRFIVERGSHPPFFLEPDNPADWPRHWTMAGFSECAGYTSAVTDDLTFEDPRTRDARRRLGDEGVVIRAFDPARAESELRRIFDLSCLAFRSNPFYASISEEEFLRHHAALVPFVSPALILLAERGDQLAGFIFAVPDLLQAQREGRSDTVVLKSLAVDPALSGRGLGGLLMDLVHRTARKAGYQRAIHALMHEANASRRISRRSARTLRRYALFSRSLH